MSSQRTVGSKEWAIERCKEWNWNYNAAEIAKELIDEGIEPGTEEMLRVKKAFLAFFPHERAVSWWGFIEDAVEVFGD